VPYAIKYRVVACLKSFDHFTVFDRIIHKFWLRDRATRPVLKRIDISVAKLDWPVQDLSGPRGVIVYLVGKLCLRLVQRRVLSVRSEGGRQMCDVLREIIEAVAVLATELS
jgi:hypothetical protein